MGFGQGLNPNSLKNLTSFKPGNPGGPGRPKGVTPFETVLRRYLEAKIDIKKHPETGEPAQVTTQEGIAMAWIAKALRGDMTAIDKIVERLDGKVAQTSILAGDPAAPIEINTTPVDILLRELAERITKQ